MYCKSKSPWLMVRSLDSLFGPQYLRFIDNRIARTLAKSRKVVQCNEVPPGTEKTHP